MTRRDWLAGLAAFGIAPPAPEPLRLIAHRGGVVEGGRAENSAAALEEAIRQRYWMAEIDLRPTRDGHLVLHHDATLQKRFADPRRVEDLTLSECRALRGPAGDRLLSIEDAAAIAAGRIRFMLDAKGGQWPPAVHDLLAARLEEKDLLRSAWVLGPESVKRRLEGRAASSIGRDDLQKLLDNGEHIAGVFLFELASAMNEDSVALARSVQIPAVAAVNEFRYVEARQDVQKGAAADIARLRALGVAHFQIDSRYAPLFAQ